MTSSVIIRTMAAADIDAVMAIAASLDTAPHWPRAAYEAAVDSASAPQRIALVAEIAGKLGGFAIASIVAPQAELETIAIDEFHQRRKAGSALLAALFRALESRRIAEITLEARASNTAAQAFYHAHSFATVARRAQYYADTDEDAVIMRALLHESPK